MLFDSATHYIRDIVHYREPLISLASKEFKVWYRNAALGFVWSLLNPLLLMVVLTFVFGVVFAERQIFSPHPFPVFVLCGLIPWTFFARSVTRSTTSLIDNASLVQKVYFPREIIPLSTVLACLLNFVLSLVVLVVFVMAFGYMPSVWIVFVPVIVLALLMFIIGMALAASCLNVFYRDVAHFIETLLLLWWWGTPIFYSHKMAYSTLVEKRGWSFLYRLYMANPMAAVVVSLRQIMLDRRCPDLDIVVSLYIVGIVSLVVGWTIFRRTQSVLADFV